MDFFGASGILVVVIPILVNFIKKIEFIGVRFAPVVAFALGVIGGVAGFYLGLAPEGTTLVQAVLLGVGIGGTSTGLYDTVNKTLFPKKT